MRRSYDENELEALGMHDEADELRLDNTRREKDRTKNALADLAEWNRKQKAKRAKKDTK